MIARGEQPTVIGCVAAVAGRCPDTSPRENRFPPNAVPRVRREISDILVSHHISTVVSSAAAGADLLALSAASLLGVRLSVVLPFSPDVFRRSSVADRGHDWVLLFDHIIEVAEAKGELVVLDTVGSGEAAYRRVNVEILSRARASAQASGSSEAPIAIAVWDGKPRPSNDLTSEFIQEAKLEGFRLIEVFTTTNAGRP